MGRFNGLGFLILGLHLTSPCQAKYAFEPVGLTPGLNFMPIELPIFCKYEDYVG